jgi:hypothetical protein
MNLTALNNITPFSVNTTLINESTEIGANLVSNANQQTGGYFGLGIMMIIFIFLLLILMQDQEVFRFNFVQAFVASSGISLMVGIIGLVSGIFTSFSHVMWFAILFIIALIAKYYQNNPEA